MGRVAREGRREVQEERESARAGKVVVQVDLVLAALAPEEARVEEVLGLMAVMGGKGAGWAG